MLAAVMIMAFVTLQPVSAATSEIKIGDQHGNYVNFTAA